MQNVATAFLRSELFLPHGLPGPKGGLIMIETMSLQQQLEPIIRKVGPENIWRPIHDRNDHLLFEGVGQYTGTIQKALNTLSFSGKSVVDLGCNFGFYSFYAAQKGAARVVGIDSDPDVIRGCRILARHYRITNVEFRVADFIYDDVPDTYDIALMVDFIGKNVIRKEKLLPCLSRLMKLARQCIFMSIIPEYDIHRVLKLAPDWVAAKYGAPFVQNERFRLIGLVQSLLGESWEISIPCDKGGRPQVTKHPLTAVKKPPILL